jgi:glycoside hydrolase-like protein
VTTARIMVTATYSTDRALVDRILASASLRVPVRGTRRIAAAPDLPGHATARMASARATVPASATDFTGKGFDACTAPSAGTMATWLRLSPYRAVGIYIGGSDRACAQHALTASWVSQQQAAGWHFMPIYVGPQAGFGEINAAPSQAVNAAQDAVSQARQLGFGPGTLLYYDMEAYPGRLNGRVLRFLTSWTNELHTLGYSSGVYSNSLSGIQALASNYTNAAVTMPDVIYDALWNGAANTLDPLLSSTQWAGHRRVHQYQGGQNVTYGGDTVNIDQDYLDVQQEVTGGSPQASQAAARPGQHGWLAGDPAVRSRVSAGQRGGIRQGQERPPAGGLLRSWDELVQASAAEDGHYRQQAGCSGPGQRPDRRVLARFGGPSPVAGRVPAGEGLEQAPEPGRPPGVGPGPCGVRQRRADRGVEGHQRPPLGDPRLGPVLGQSTGAWASWAVLPQSPARRVAS